MEREKKKKKSPLPFSLAPYPKIVQDQEPLVNLTASPQVKKILASCHILIQTWKMSIFWIASCGIRRGGLGDPPPILGHTWPYDIKRGVWGDPPPILGHTCIMLPFYLHNL